MWIISQKSKSKRIITFFAVPLQAVKNYFRQIQDRMLWFKFSFGAKFLKLVQLLFSFVMYSLPYSGTLANKIEIS